MTIENIHRAWHDLDAATDRDEIITRWPALAYVLTNLNRITAIQYDAAAEIVRSQNQEHELVSDLVLGKPDRMRGRRVEQFVKLGEDYLVQVKGALADPNTLNWTFTFGGKRTNWYHPDQEMALLHLIATRHDPNPNSNHMWAAAAARVLGVSEPEE